MTQDSSGVRRWGVLVTIVVVAIVGVVYLTWKATQDGPASLEDPPVVRPDGNEQNKGNFSTTSVARIPVKPPGYVGIDACIECHAERVAEVKKTNHFLACREPRPEDMPDGFGPDAGSFVSRYPEIHFEMTRKGDEYFQTSVRTMPEGEQRTVARIDLVYGAGTADDVYLSWQEDGGLVELPMTWLYASAEWGNAAFDRNGKGDFGRPVTPRCFECHNTWFHHFPGTRNAYQREHALVGVQCESCHGPAQKHVDYHKANPKEVDGREIINPGELSQERKLDVCIQCHSNSIYHLGRAFRYRPGEPLEDYYKTVVVKNEDDHVANQIHYLRQSKCFQEDDTLNCITCHDPHSSRHHDDSSNSGSISCMACHETKHCQEQERLPAAMPENIRGDCVACHMPQYYKANVVMDTANGLYVPPMRRYQHRIAVHPAARDDVLLAWHRTQDNDESRQEVERLTAALVDYWLDDAEQRHGEYRFRAAIASAREAMRVDPTTTSADKLQEFVEVEDKWNDDSAEALRLIAENQSSEAIAMLESILKIKPDDAKAYGRLGTEYAKRGETQLAIKNWELAAKYGPHDPYGHGMLGWQAYLQDRPQDAIEHFRHAETAEPYQWKNSNNMGLAFIKLNRFSDAETSFRRAIEIDPRQLGSYQFLGVSLIQQGKGKDAIAVLENAAEFSRYQNIDVLMGLSDAHASVNDSTEAIRVVKRALEVARRTQPSIVPRIEQRLRQLQANKSQ